MANLARSNPIEDKEINPPLRWIDGISEMHRLDIDLPGFTKDDIKARLTESMGQATLTVSGRRKVDDDNQEHFEKTIILPEAADFKNIESKFEEGVLSVQLPKMVLEEIKPSSGWTDDFPGYHCILINLPGFAGDDIKMNTDKAGIITINGSRIIDKKKQHFKKTFSVPEEGDVKNIQKMFNEGTLIVLIPKPVEEEINPSSRWTDDIPRSYCRCIDLPGFKEDDIKLNVDKHGIIVVSGRGKVGDDEKRVHFEVTFSIPEDGDIKNIRRRFNDPNKLEVIIPKMVVEEINPSRWTRDYHGFHCLLVNLPGFTGDDIELNVDESVIIVVSGRRRVDDKKQEHFEIKFNMKEDGNVKNIQKVFNVDTLAIFIPKLVEEEIIPSSKWTDDIPESHCLLLKLPAGFKEDDIKLNVDKDGSIVVSGRRKVGDDKIEQFVRTFNNVPEDGDVKNIQKIFKGDTLRLCIRKMVVEEINPSSGWTDEFPGYYCILMTLPGFTDADIKVNVNKPGIIMLSGRRRVDDEKQEHFEKTFDVPTDGDVTNVTYKFDGATLRVFIPKPVKEEIIPSSGWTNEIIGSHCLLVNLPVFNKEDMKMEVDKSGVIVVRGWRRVGDRKEESFEKAFYVPDNRDMKNVSETYEGDTLKVCIPKRQ